MPDCDLLPCCKCGGPVVEFTIPNAAWNTIIRDDGHETDQEYLCLECFAGIAAEKMKRLRLELEGVNCEHRAKVFKERGEEVERLREYVGNGMFHSDYRTATELRAAMEHYRAEVERLEAEKGIVEVQRDAARQRDNAKLVSGLETEVERLMAELRAARKRCKVVGECSECGGYNWQLPEGATVCLCESSVEAAESKGELNA